MRLDGAPRATALTWTATCALVLTFALAASSGPIRLWINPTSDRAAPTVESSPGEVTQPTDREPVGTVSTPWVGSILTVIGSMILGLVVVGGLLLTRELGGSMWLAGRGNPRRRSSSRAPVVIPVMPPRRPQLDVEAAETALATGTPRNAIVGCWMQLERDASSVGLPRMSAETPSEYVQRVVDISSVDSRPIAELAALYREARFSRHDLSDDDRARAGTALRGVVDQLQFGVTNSP